MLTSTHAPPADPVLHPTPCAICGGDVPATELYPATFTPADLNAAVFSARRLPDSIHYRMVRCDQCGLVRSDPVADGDILTDLYREARFDYSDEVECLRASYGRALAEATRLRGDVGRLLEVGCGNGFLLDTALDMGFTSVRGVEPSADAIAKAPDRVRERIVGDVMRDGLFAESSFDIICLFQVFDHLPDPRGVLAECARVLSPGGVILCFNHNVEALPARILRRRCPIIDIEHTYLYSPRTLSLVFRKSGLEVLRVGPVRNRYTVRYLTHLLPIPRRLRKMIAMGLDVSRLGGVQLWLPLGNMRVIARKARG